jgi:Zn-dependent protease with chaperone function
LRSVGSRNWRAALAFAIAGLSLGAKPSFPGLWEPTAYDETLERELVFELQRLDVSVAMHFVRANNAAREGDHRRAARLYGLVEQRVPSFSPARRLRLRETLALGWKESAVDEWRELARSQGSVDDIVSLASYLTRASSERADGSELLEEASGWLAKVGRGNFQAPEAELVRARIGARSNRWSLVEEAQRNLARAGAEEPLTWWAVARVLADEGEKQFAGRALASARAAGLSPELETEANRWYLQSIRPRSVERKTTFVSTTHLLRLLVLPLAALFAVWLALLITVRSFGARLGRQVDEALVRWEGGGPEPGAALSAEWSRKYDRLVRLGAGLFWAGLPVATMLSLGATVAIGAAIQELSSGNAIFAVIWLVPSAAATLFAFGTTLRRWQQPEPPPEPFELDLGTAEGFRDLLAATAEAARVRRIQRVFLNSGCEFAVARIPASPGGERSETVLALPVGLLDALDVSELRAIVAHEYGHLVDWGAGGHFAVRVRDRLESLAAEMIRRRAAGILNPAWWFVAFFAAAFGRLSLGASRFQELQADRFAAKLCGAEVCISALERSVERDVRFAAHADAVLTDAIERFIVIERLYEVPVRERSEEREQAVLDAIDESLSAETVSPFDSHPPIGRRLTWLRRMAEDGVGYPRGERDSRPAWSLFDARSSIELRATEQFRQRIELEQEIRLRRPEAVERTA